MASQTTAPMSPRRTAAEATLIVMIARNIAVIRRLLMIWRSLALDCAA